jgi:hypothetical protein
MSVEVKLGHVEAQHNEDLTKIDDDDDSPEVCGITVTG